MWHGQREIETFVFMGPRFRGDDSNRCAASRRNHRLMSTVAEPLHERRAAGDLLPATMLLVVIFASVVILAHLGVVLWLAWTSGTPGDPDLVYTARNFVEVFSDGRTWSVLVDTLAFALVSLVIAL